MPMHNPTIGPFLASQDIIQGLPIAYFSSTYQLYTRERGFGDEASAAVHIAYLTVSLANLEFFLHKSDKMIVIKFKMGGINVSAITFFFSLGSCTLSCLAPSEWPLTVTTEYMWNHFILLNWYLVSWQWFTSEDQHCLEGDVLAKPQLTLYYRAFLLAT